MDILPYIYFFYMFVSLYFLSFYILLYIKNRDRLLDSPKLKKHFSVSMVVPCYNDEESIGGAIEAFLASDYKNLKKIFVVDDCSTDNSYEIIKRYAKKYSRVIALQTPKNTGNAAGAKNYGAKFVDTDLIAFADSDSYPAKDALSKMVPYFNDEKIGAVTCPIFARNKTKFFEVLQAVEYTAIALTRKLLESVDAIYVTPGPLALYRRKAFVEVGGFDSKNITEDIEFTWHLIVNGWDRKMCMDTNVTTWVPTNFKQWISQRRRWSMGGLQCMLKYKQQFLKKNIMGLFVWPFFVLNSFLGLLGLSLFAYLSVSRLIKQYFLMKFSFIANTALVKMNSFYFTPSVLNYFGIVLFVLGTIFTLFVLFIMKEDALKKRNFFKILIYLTLYLMVYPFIMISAIYKLIRKDMRW